MVSFVAEVASQHPQVVISVDTWRADVGRAVVAEGATLLNDAWGAHDPQLAEVAAEHGVGLVCTHAGGLAPRTRPHRVAYPDVMAAVVDDVVGQARRAVELGVSSSSILIDPGMTSARTPGIPGMHPPLRLRWSPPGGRSWSR